MIGIAGQAIVEQLDGAEGGNHPNPGITFDQRYVAKQRGLSSSSSDRVAHAGSR